MTRRAFLEDSSVTIPVLGNDYDVDGDPLSVSIVSGPTQTAGPR